MLVCGGMERSQLLGWQALCVMECMYLQSALREACCKILWWLLLQESLRTAKGLCQSHPHPLYPQPLCVFCRSFQTVNILAAHL